MIAGNCSQAELNIKNKLCVCYLKLLQFEWTWLRSPARACPLVLCSVRIQDKKLFCAPMFVIKLSKQAERSKWCPVDKSPACLTCLFACFLVCSSFFFLPSSNSFALQSILRCLFHKDIALITRKTLFSLHSCIKWMFRLFLKGLWGLFVLFSMHC